MLGGILGGAAAIIRWGGESSRAESLDGEDIEKIRDCTLTKSHSWETLKGSVLAVSHHYADRNGSVGIYSELRGKATTRELFVPSRCC